MWEYNSITLSNDRDWDEFDEMGKEGWEAYSAFPKFPHSEQIIVMVKREIKPEESAT